jgi:hypothetical protein
MPVKLTAFVISGALTGLAGGLWFYFIDQVQPQTGFDPLFDLTIALMAFLGGLGTPAVPSSVPDHRASAAVPDITFSNISEPDPLLRCRRCHLRAARPVPTVVDNGRAARSAHKSVRASGTSTSRC